MFFCNSKDMFTDHSSGVHLVFVRNMLKAFSESELILLGITINSSLPVEKWANRTRACTVC